MNRSANDGTVTRFGWKAQNKSLIIFAGEAYNVEQGVTNDIFPQERESATDCRYNATPEDHINSILKLPKGVLFSLHRQAITCLNSATATKQSK